MKQFVKALVFRRYEQNNSMTSPVNSAFRTPHNINCNPAYPVVHRCSEACIGMFRTLVIAGYSLPLRGHSCICAAFSVLTDRIGLQGTCLIKDPGLKAAPLGSAPPDSFVGVGCVVSRCASVANVVPFSSLFGKQGLKRIA